MIATSDIRIGNLLLINNSIEEVTHIKPNLVVFDHSDIKKPAVRPEFINGVKLTPELLEKLGYKDIGGVGVFCYDFETMGRRYEYDMEDIGKGTYDFSCNRSIICEVEFLHQLQNIHYFLTKIELKDAYLKDEKDKK